MKEQILHRLGIAHVRDVMARFVGGDLSHDQVMEELRIGKTRLYELRGLFLAARAAGKADMWTPGVSGGNHATPWPEEVHRFLRRVLSPDGETKRYSYAFAASEAGRLFGLTLDRAQVRHWAIEQGIKIAVPKPRPPAHARRWQRSNIGELWQLDATPDYFLGRGKPMLNLLNMLDDCSRMQVGCKLFLRECVASYLDLFYTAFLRFGLPLQIYVDKAGFFRGDDGQLTQLGKRLHFYDISFVFANAPESKGKIERLHQIWQDRLPAYCEREGIDENTPLEELNERLGELVDYRNGYEKHRELGRSAQEAWDEAVAQGRNKLRPIPWDGWWELVWSEWSKGVIGRRGRLLVDGILCTTECVNGTRTWICRHVDGSVSLCLNKPDHQTRPKVVFTTNPHLLKA